MADVTQAHAKDLEDYRSLIARRWGWVVLGLVLGVIGSLVYLQVKTPTYTSTAKVRVESTVADTQQDVSRTAGPVNLDTEAQLVTSTAVAEQVAAQLGTDAKPSALAKRVVVSVPPNTTVLAIAFSASTRAAAQAGAQAFADAYLANRQQIADKIVGDEITTLRDKIDSLNEDITTNIEALNSKTNPLSPADAAVLQARQLQLKGQVDRLQAQLDPLEASIVRPGSVITAAQLPAKPTKPSRMLVLASGLMAGLLLGLGLATLRDRLDRRLHSAAEVEKLFGLAVVGEVDLRKHDLTAAVLDEDLARSMRGLALAVEAAVPAVSPLVLVVPASDASLARDISRELALGAASTGSRTGLLTRRESAKSEIPVIRRRREGADLRLVSYEKVHVAGDEGLNASAVHEALDRVRDERDFVVLDPLTGEQSVDLPILARHVDLIVVIIELGRTTRPHLESLITLAHRSGAPAMCAVTVRRSRKSKPARDDISALRDKKSRKTQTGSDEDKPATSGPVIPG
jgi:capsular polysaccharide biosynthesis protein